MISKNWARELMVVQIWLQTWTVRDGSNQQTIATGGPLNHWNWTTDSMFGRQPRLSRLIHAMLRSGVFEQRARWRSRVSNFPGFTDKG